MILNRNLVLVLLFGLSSTVGFSQKQDKRLEKANKKYEEFSFIEARKLYGQLVEKGYTTKEVYGRLGDTYYFNSDYTKALEWYTKLMDLGGTPAPEYYFRYSQALRANQDYSQALTAMETYYSKMGKEEEAKKWRLKEYMAAIQEQSGRYDEITEAKINSGLSDMGAALVPNEETIKQAGEIAQFEKEEKARIAREKKEQRMDDDERALAARSETAAKNKNKEDVPVKVFEQLPKYKEIIYATAKDSGVFIKRKHNWNEKPFLKLYTATINNEGRLENEKKLPGDINARYHQSTPVITKDGTMMYFTRLELYHNKKTAGKNKKEVSQLKLYQAQKINGVWTNIVQLPYPINVDGASSGHPALSPDDSQLFFVSNRKNKMGNTDIYVVNRKKGGGLESKVEALDDKINTLGRETFPFVDDNGILYFASDGHPGMGGLDIFAAAKDSNGTYVVVNIGEPVNSVYDDFAYVIDNETKRGFFTSNKPGGSGDDDLYEFLENKPIRFPFNLNAVYFGTVKDSMTTEPIAGVSVVIFNERNEKIKTVLTDSLGKYTLDLPPLRNHTFLFKKKGYASEKVLVDGVKISERKEISVALFNELSVIVDDKVVTLKEGDDLTEKLKLNPIYFDYGGYSIRKSSEKELDKVIDLIKNRPSISIEVRSHTDSRGKDDFNMRLSKNRAKATIDYIIHKGAISPERIWGDGYGESQLINNCGNGVKCTEAEHELNRRSEFIIILKDQAPEKE
ncbi:OmpA family protein [Flavobacterium sp. UBA4197]|uniref:OmpA family protein n=1 Tax=Flavobacterium sp. UBA4197 TaxID=1946546 RepID=UPI00257FBEDF|nr:OmpA family protein [Flavobacterium sp. UBA4197]